MSEDGLLNNRASEFIRMKREIKELKESLARTAALWAIHDRRMIDAKAALAAMTKERDDLYVSRFNERQATAFEFGRLLNELASLRAMKAALKEAEACLATSARQIRTMDAALIDIKAKIAALEKE